MVWSEYRKKRGTLSVPRRIEQGFGMLMHLYSAMHGGKGTLQSFCPHESYEEEPLDPVSDVMRAMKNSGAIVKRRGE